MKIPSTEDSLYDGSRTFHQFTDPPSSTLFVLPSSPPAVDVPMIDVEDEEVNTDMDTDADEEADGWQNTYINPAQSSAQSARTQTTLRTMSNAARAVARKSFSMDADASTFIQRVFDDPDSMIDKKGLLTVNFESMGLEKLPEDFGDLQMLCPRPSQIMMFCAKNYIHSLPSFLFDMSNITVLSLRDNQLTSLPPAIMNLKNLQELHVGGNQLRYLPYELTQLSLDTLTCIPNPLMRPKGTGMCGGLDSSLAKSGTPNELLAEEYFVSDKPATLLETSMAVYLESKQMQHLARLPKHLQAHIEQQAAIKNQCSLCKSAYIHEAAEIIRWFSIFRQSCVPFKLGFCSTRCYLHYAFPHSSDR